MPQVGRQCLRGGYWTMMRYLESGPVVGIFIRFKWLLICINSIQVWRLRCIWLIPLPSRRMYRGRCWTLIFLWDVEGLLSAQILPDRTIVMLVCLDSSPFSQWLMVKWKNVRPVISDAGLVSVPMCAWLAFRTLSSIPIPECANFLNSLPH